MKADEFLEQYGESLVKLIEEKKTEKAKKDIADLVSKISYKVSDKTLKENGFICTHDSLELEKEYHTEQSCEVQVIAVKCTKCGKKLLEEKEILT